MTSVAHCLSLSYDTSLSPLCYVKCLLIFSILDCKPHEGKVHAYFSLYPLECLTQSKNQIFIG